MSGAVMNLESDTASLCQEAKDLGASQAVAIRAIDIVLDERTLLKCSVPICLHYGIDLMCPPNVLPMSKFKEVIGCYHRAILIKLDVPLSDLPGGSGKGGEQPGAPGAEYRNVIREAKKRLHEVVCQVESACFKKGYRFAAGLGGGSCPLCDECVGVKSGLPCRHPFRARPAMEAMGIDVIATTEKAGLHLSFSQNEGRSWVGLVLVA